MGIVSGWLRDFSKGSIMRTRWFLRWAGLAACLIPLAFTVGQDKDQPVAKVDKPV